MLKINIGNLKEKNQDLITFLEEKLKIKSSKEGDKIIFEDEESKLKKPLVKTYLKRFLHKNNFKDYRVLVKGNEMKIVELKTEE